jgi:hypothetical protein
VRPPLKQELNQWVDTGIIDQETADRIRAFASSPKSPGLRWPAVLAIAFGTLMWGLASCFSSQRTGKIFHPPSDSYWCWLW